jgi:pilus assembly protein CpaB
MSLRLAVVALMLATATGLGLIAYQVAAPVRMGMAPAAPTAMPAPLLINYLAAARALPAGTLARDEDFAIKSVPAAELPPNAITDAPGVRAGLRGALIRTYLDAGAPITAENILRPRDRGFIASVLSPQMRAVSVGVDPVSGVSGLIWPGDHVDVILTQAMDKAPVAQRVLSETILRNVRVIAIDQEIVQGAPAGASAAGRPTHTVTLEVSIEQAEKLTVAQQLGRLALAIRSATDQADALVAAGPTMFGADVSPALSNTTEPVGMTVHVVEGDKSKEVTFR